jgi:hypothetical protein
VGPWSASFSSSPSKDPTWLGSKVLQFIIRVQYKYCF